MDRIWAPWRGDYLNKSPEKQCFLCRILQENRDRDNYVLSRGEKSFVLLNLYPYNTGHLMIAPLRHTASLSSLTTEEREEIFNFIKASEEGLTKYMKCEGINIGLNLGKVAGAGLLDHIHIHMVPRWSGDTNFMPVVFETKVLSQYLSQVYNILLPTYGK